MMYLNGNHLSNYSQPIHFHYPINRRLGSRVASDSTISSSLIIDRPSRVRVSLYESGRPGSIVSPETPEPLSTFNSINNNNNQLNCCSTISRIVNPPLSSSAASNYPNHHHQQSISHSTLSSSTVNHTHHNQEHHPQQQQLTLDLVKMMERKVSVDSGIENPFRPGGELSREAETIVNLIKEGKPITPTTPTKELTSEGDSKILNGISNNQIPSSNHHQLSPTNGKLSPNGGTGSITPTRNNLNHSNGGSKLSRTAGDNGIGSDSKVYPQSNDLNSKLNGSSKLMLIHTTSNGGTSPGIVEVERSIVTPTEPPKADMVTIKKQKKCICCVVQ